MLVDTVFVKGCTREVVLECSSDTVVRGQVNRPLEVGLRFDCKRLHAEILRA